MYYATLFVFGVSTLFPLTVVAATEMDTACVCVCVCIGLLTPPNLTQEPQILVYVFM